jgi:hypothetical protein
MTGAGRRAAPNQSLQQMKPPVTSLADASAAPAVFTAEARCWAGNGDSRRSRPRMAS